MSRLLKFLGYAFAALLALLLLAGATVYVLSERRLTRRYDPAVRPVDTATDETTLLRGKHLASTRGCIDCHGADLGGAKVVDDPAVGQLHGPNLTRGAGGVPADLTPTDWVRALRHGVDRTGRPLVLMPSHEYAEFTVEDMTALVSYLQQLPAVDRPSGPVALGPLGRVLLVAGQFKLAAEEIDHARVQPATVVPGVSVAYGRYLSASCIGCHGESLAGGKIPGAPPDWPAAANLTQHGAVRGWTEADFLSALRTGQRPDGSALSPVMPRAFGQMTDEELRALWLYLQTVQPVGPDGKPVQVAKLSW